MNAPVRRPAKAVTSQRQRIGERILFGYSLLIIGWLFLPIFVMIFFGFNDTQGRYNTAWNGFTLKWYGRLFEYPELTKALGRSLIIATLTMLIAGVLGTLIGVALGRYCFKGHGAANFIIFTAISFPELILGASLLSLFVSAGTGLGIITILIAHVMFSIPFVSVVVQARVLTLDCEIEEAARDLGAGPWATFRLVTMPMIFPAILSGGLLAFALSIDDFVITNFTAGTTITFPLWIWGVTRVGIPPQVNIMGTLIFAIGMLIAAVNIVTAKSRLR